MLSAIAIVPSAPVMVPELASGAAAELADLREAAITAARSLPDRWIAIGVGPSDAFVGMDRSGTFAGYGVDVRVALAPAASPTGGSGLRREIVALAAEGLSYREIGERLVVSARTVEGHLLRAEAHSRSSAEPDGLPLCALIAGWIRGQVAPAARVSVQVYADDHGVDAALDRGRRLRAEIDEAADPVGLLVVADGANTLTPPAPGGYDPDSIPVQTALDDALAAGDAASLARLSETIVGRVAYQVLAGLEPTPRSVKELYRGAPYGVGYFAGVWLP